MDRIVLVANARSERVGGTSLVCQLNSARHDAAGAADTDTRFQGERIFSSSPANDVKSLQVIYGTNSALSIHSNTGNGKSTIASTPQPKRQPCPSQSQHTYS